MISAFVRRITGASLIAALATMVVGCDNRAGLSPPDEEAAGAYTGSLNADINGVPTAFPLEGMISGNNNLEMYFPGGGAAIAGPVTVSQTKFDGNLTVFVGEAGHFYGMDGLDTLILDGHLTAKSGGNGWFGTTGLSGTYALTYNATSGNFSSLELTQGSWSINDGGYSANFTVDISGAVSGTDSNACAFAGTLAVIDETQSVYELGMTVSNCGMNNGDYAGTVSLATSGGLDLDQMKIGMSNDISAYAVVIRNT